MGAGERIRSMLDGLDDHASVSLSPVERLLLATDGTVTHMLEALTRGEVDVDILDRDVDGSTLTRRVVLRRSSDGSPLVWAASEVNLHPLPMAMEDELVEGDIGIGDLLRDQYEETRREIIDMRPVWAGDDELPTFISGHSTLYLARAYDVYSDGQRIMQISEFFPKGLF